MGARGRAVGVVTRLRVGRSGVPFPAGRELYLFSESPDTLCSHSASCLMGNGSYRIFSNLIRALFAVSEG
jgi:hypothetical protein